MLRLYTLSLPSGKAARITGKDVTSRLIDSYKLSMGCPSPRQFHTVTMAIVSQKARQNRVVSRWLGKTQVDELLALPHFSFFLTRS